MVRKVIKDGNEDVYQLHKSGPQEDINDNIEMGEITQPASESPEQGDNPEPLSGESA